MVNETDESEIIIKVTINCVERGLLMLRARDEINVTLGRLTNQLIEPAD